jgi:hypothetical protein
MCRVAGVVPLNRDSTSKVTGDELTIGDILYDVDSKDIGILLRCHDNGEKGLEEEYNVCAWEIYWMKEGTQFYSEYGLRIRIEANDFLKFGHM